MELTTYVYPAVLRRAPEGGFSVTFPDVPEAITQGDDETEALAMAADCLATAISWRMTRNRPVPLPSPVRNRPAIPLSPLLATKAALRAAMRERRLSKANLAKRLGMKSADVARMLDPSAETKMGQLADGLAACDRSVHVTVGPHYRNGRVSDHRRSGTRATARRKPAPKRKQA